MCRIYMCLVVSFHEMIIACLPKLVMLMRGSVAIQHQLCSVHLRGHHKSNQLGRNLFL